MNKIAMFLIMMLVGFVHAATVTVPASNSVVTVEGKSHAVRILDVTFASKNETVYSAPINISGITLQAFDSLGQVAKVGLGIGTFTAVCTDIRDSAAVVDSVNLALFVEALDLSYDASVPTQGDGWYAVDSMKILGNGDAAAKVKRSKYMSLATEAPVFLRGRLVGLSGLSYAVPKCKVSYTRKGRD